MTEVRHVTKFECAHYYTIKDGYGGTLIVMNLPSICPQCGGFAEQVMSYSWKETKHPELTRMGMSVKHYATICHDCGYDAYS